MPVTSVTTDVENLTMAVTVDVSASAARLWEAFTDPRQLERFWGPPGWPATFETFDLSVGGRATYAMLAATGESPRGSWEFLRIDAPRSFEVIDSFVDESGTPIEGMPAMRMEFVFEATDTGARMTNTTFFTSVDALHQIVEMGAAEGSTLAMNQLDVVLMGLREYAEGKGTQTELLTDTHVRITRLIEGPREVVWRAHTDPDLMKRWMLGPDGWRMSVCEIDPSVGGTYRYAWEPEGGTEGESFGFDGQTLVSQHPHRLVTTEHMTGTDFPATTNDMSLEEEDGATFLTLLVEYPDKDTRDMVLATGMTDGMEASYARLEGVLSSER